MATNNAAELLIRIAADPSQAESSIQQFRSNFGSNLNGLNSDLSQWSSRGTSSFGSVQKSLQGLTTNFGTSLGSLNSSLNLNRQAISQWKSETSNAFTTALSASGALETSLLGSFKLFDSALVRNAGNARVWQKSIGQAFEKAALTSITAIAKEAVVRAIFSTALGFYLLQQHEQKHVIEQRVWKQQVFHDEDSECPERRSETADGPGDFPGACLWRTGGRR
ncbi:MAG: hypothetical protein P8Z30_18580 [Acidobacteriota bacterium]